MANNLVDALLVVFGCLFMLLAAIGVLRMPDVYMRISTSTKAATFGAGCILLAVAVHFRELSVSSRALAILVIIFITSPVAAHIIGRAAYVVGVPLWKGTVADELRGRYDSRSGELTSGQADDDTARPAQP